MQYNLTFVWGSGRTHEIISPVVPTPNSKLRLSSQFMGTKEVGDVVFDYKDNGACSVVVYLGDKK